MSDSSLALLAGVAVIGYLAIQSQKAAAAERERTEAAAKRTTGEQIGGAGETLFNFGKSIYNAFD
jgi:threonine/homoserine/homoserine lactone efflux protein